MIKIRLEGGPNDGEEIEISRKTFKTGVVRVLIYKCKELWSAYPPSITAEIDYKVSVYERQPFRTSSGRLYYRWIYIG